MERPQGKDREFCVDQSVATLLFFRREIENKFCRVLRDQCIGYIFAIIKKFGKFVVQQMHCAKKWCVIFVAFSGSQTVVVTLSS